MISCLSFVVEVRLCFCFCFGLLMKLKECSHTYVHIVCTYINTIDERDLFLCDVKLIIVILVYGTGSPINDFIILLAVLPSLSDLSVFQ